MLVDAPPSCSSEVKSLLETRFILVEIWLARTLGPYCWVKEVIGCETKISGHRADKQLFDNPSIMSGFALPDVSLVPVRIDRWVENGDLLDLWGREVRVFAPGIALCVGFYLASENLCFVGDVIFHQQCWPDRLTGRGFSGIGKFHQRKDLHPA